MRYIRNSGKISGRHGVFSLTVIREDDDSRVRSESDFFHRLKNVLIKQGHDVIKKLMWKDGHMVNDEIYYIRTRKPEGFGSYMVWDGDYQTRLIHEDFNDQGSVKLQVTGDFPVPPRSVLDWRPKG